MDELAAEAPAKLNLTLRVLGRRPDGFHEVVSLAALIELADQVRVRTRPAGPVTLDCDDPTIPRDASNLAVRAAELMRARLGVRAGVHVTLAKRIPPGAGLGGGSSDAACVMTLLNRLWAGHQSADTLSGWGAELGSDVPLFFNGPVALLTGRGEHVMRLPVRITACAVLLVPRFGCSTARVYAAWDDLATRGARPAAPPDDPVEEAVEIGELLRTGTPAAEVMRRLHNDLEPAARAAEPAFDELCRRIEALADGPVRMSGSGSALYRILDDRAEARRFAERLHAATGQRVEVVGFAGTGLPPDRPPSPLPRA